MVSLRTDYYPEMNKDEVLMILTYDSAMSPFVPTLHTSFSVPGMPEDAPARRSCEARVLCLLPNEAAKLCTLQLRKCISCSWNQFCRKTTLLCEDFTLKACRRRSRAI